MDDLREAIEQVRPNNTERKRWVPESRLTQLLTKDVVHTVLTASSIRKYRLEDTVRDVIRGGKKILAILVLLNRPELILCLIEDDQLQNNAHAVGVYRACFSGSIVPRVLHDEVILPFVAENPLESGIGSFGTVYVTTIEPSHHRFPEIQLARKEFKVTKLVKADYELELHNLSLLKTLEHPNLLKLLGAYTYRRKHNLLFPLASQGTLAMLFEEECPPHYQHMLQPTMDLFNQICSRTEHIQATVEQQRLRSWEAICVSGHNNGVEFWSQFSISEFDFILRPLQELLDSLEVISTMKDGANYNIFRSIRVLNDSLLEVLSRYLQESIQSHFEIYMLNSEDDTFLHSHCENIIGMPLTRRAGQLAAMKQLSSLVTGRNFQNRPDLAVGPTDLISPRPVGDFYVAEINDTYLGGSRKVLIEKKNYREECSSEQVATELLGRLEAIADLLGSNSTSRFPGVLACSNYFLDVTRCEFGLLYDFPRTPLPELKVITLQSLFDRGSSRQRLPPLGFRFRIAVELASSLLDFHKASWLHESISSSCVAVFHSPDPTWNAGEYQMYILGFLHSRRDDPNAFTIGPPEDEHRMLYHHPTYLKYSPRYRAEFDYYSLGLVLLEIGLWKPLHMLSKSWEGSHDDLRVELLKRRVPQLAGTVGEVYRDVVQTCLNGSFEAVGAEEGNPEAAELHYSFKRRVVDQLRICKA